MGKLGRTALAWCLAILAGCAVFPGKHATQQPKPPEFVGKVYLFRGGAGGVFSTGMDRWAEQLTDIGVVNVVGSHFVWRSWVETIKKDHEKEPGPIVLVGHSWGGDATLRIARELDKANIPVALIVTVDAVTNIPVAKNVHKAYNLYESNAFWDRTPIWHGIVLEADSALTQVENVRLNDRPDLNTAGINHATIDDSPLVQQEAIRQILKTCKR